MKSSIVQFVASLLIVLASLAPASLAQSSSSGAITGSAIDPSGAVVVGAEITATNDATGDVRTAVSTSNGVFLFPLLSPGSYTLKTSKAGFKELVRTGVLVTVTETVRANLQLQIGKVSETVTVTTEPELLKTEDSALGDVTNARAVLSLPLASRNYTQIIGLSPGVSSEVTDASALGRGTGSDAAGANGFSSHGASTNDNNYQVNGVEVNDLMGSGNLSGGVAVPNPDSIQEFKVQTGQYDASYGRNAGANVDLVTKTGGNQVHGSLFEFFRNEDLNANDYFRNLNQQPRGVFKQNQFGGSLGGHIVKDKLFYFGSYQGTRQRNGLAAGSCATGVLSPPLTDDRSRAGLGALFSGPTGGAIAADGSNISDQAFALLNLKLANGKFAIPTPQTVDPSSPLGFFGEGSSSFSQSCPFTENQFLVDADYLQSAKSSLSGSFLFSNTSTTSTLTTNGNVPGSGVPGSPSTTLNQYRVFSLIHRYSFSSNLINQASLGFHRLVGDLVQTAPFKYSDIGVTVPAFEDSFPNVGVTGSFQIGGNGQGVKLAQNAYNFSDAISWTRGRQSLHFGGGIERSQINQVGFHFIAGLGFPTYEQFLLGNANTGVDLAGLLDRYWRTWGGNLYAQDNIKITSKFTVNLGLRYERQGDLGDLLGRNSSFDPLQADHTGAGSQAGYVVASNFSGDLPPGIIRAPNEAATNGLGQNTWGPRVGFSWQMPGSDRVVLRGGYGIFYSRTTAQPILQELTSPPFGEFRQLAGVIPFANPFPPLPVLPSFPSYSLENCSISFDPACLFFVNISTNIKPPTIQQYSLETQVALAHNFALEIGYQGARGTKLMEERSFNQALLASVSNPVNGAIDNTFSNVTQRTPVPGISPFMFEVGSGGASWYNALAVSLNKRISKGLQFLASYTWSSSLGTSQNFATGTQLGGVAFGDQNNPRARYGWDQFVRPQRFILSWVYQFPAFDHRSLAMRKVLGGWSVAGVTTIQSGQRLTVTAANLPSVFGTDLNDRAPASAAGCGTRFVNSGTVQNKLSNYINKSCFDLGNFPVIGDDGVGTGFGNSGIGEVRGPDQNNWDLSLQKATGLTERVQLQFRSDFFNAFNHAQFSNPDLNLGENALSLFGVTLPNASFGTIQTTSTNPRILQFSLRLVF